MSVGKKSIARAANAAAKAELAPEEKAETVKEEVLAETEAVSNAAEEPKAAKLPEKFKKVSVGDDMPAFLL